MIEQIKDLPVGTVGFVGSGLVSSDDYENIIVPDIEAAFAVSRRLRLLYVLGQEFQGFGEGAMWDDFKMSMRHFTGWDRVAVVSDVGSMRATAQVFGFAVPGHFRLFPMAELESARAWILEPHEVESAE